VTADDDIDDDIDRLYGVAPQDFTALRTELVAAAKKRGDARAAKQIAAARRPTAAAWVVNAMVHESGDARTRLGELAERLRAAHASMDGPRIRELTTAQRKLIDELARAGFVAAGIDEPSAALRDDVVGTLQAAIADPDVAARLGRLAKAERWSGFGDFGAVSATTAAPTPEPKAASKPEAGAGPAKGEAPKPSRAEVAAASRRVAAAERAAAAADRTHAKAAAIVSDRAAELAAARRRYERLLESLAVAEREMNAADAEHREAERAADAAAERLEAARAALAEARRPPDDASR
jgi:hypothetical protein